LRNDKHYQYQAVNCSTLVHFHANETNYHLKSTLKGGRAKLWQQIFKDRALSLFFKNVQKKRKK